MRQILRNRNKSFARRTGWLYIYFWGATEWPCARPAGRLGRLKGAQSAGATYARFLRDVKIPYFFENFP
jgi:hypothetical protein